MFFERGTGTIFLIYFDYLYGYHTSNFFPLLLSVTIKFFGKPRTESLASLIKSTDAELVRYYQKTEDMQAISLLMDRYSDAIVGLSMRYLKNEEDVRDFANDMYMKLVDKLRDADVRNFRAWLLTTVNNKLNDLGRKAKVRTGYANSFKGKGEETIEENLDFGMDHHLIQSALGMLSEKEQQIIHDLYFEEKSYQDIMDEMGLTFNQVRGTRDRAIKKLKISLGADFGQYFKE